MRIPRDFKHLRGTLTGISDRLLEQHLALYGREVDRLNAIQSAYPLTGQQAVTDGHTNAQDLPLLGQPVRNLPLAFGHLVGPLRDAMQLVRLEWDYIKPRPPAFWPNWYFGTEDFWTSDKAVSINVPWYLATAQLWRLAGRTQEFNFSFDQVLRCLRHELGHAVFFGYALGAHPLWLAAFGDPTVPYPQRDDVLITDKHSQGYVEYLSYAPAHYAQKHPEEAWAEAFGRWLDSGPKDWRAEYAAWPEALAKLEAVDLLMQDLAGKSATNTYLGRPDPHTTLRGTVADRLGVPRAVQPFTSMGWSEHGELLRQEPGAYNGVALHELYFEQFKPAAPNTVDPIPPLLMRVVEQGWGQWPHFLLDLRAACGSTNGWALVVWDEAENRPRINLVEQHANGVMAGCPILLAIDCWEHAYAVDYGTRKDLYLGAVFEGMNWSMVGDRLLTCKPVAMRLDDPTSTVAEREAAQQAVAETDDPQVITQFEEYTGSP